MFVALKFHVNSFCLLLLVTIKITYNGQQMPEMSVNFYAENGVLDLCGVV